MTIDEAIKALERQLVSKRAFHSTFHAEALQLGIEALKAVKHYRSNPHLHQVYRLEGETVE